MSMILDDSALAELPSDERARRLQIRNQIRASLPRHETWVARSPRANRGDPGREGGAGSRASARWLVHITSLAPSNLFARSGEDFPC